MAKRKISGIINATEHPMIPWCFKIHRMLGRVDDSAYFPFCHNTCLLYTSITYRNHVHILAVRHACNPLTAVLLALYLSLIHI